MALIMSVDVRFISQMICCFYLSSCGLRKIVFTFGLKCDGTLNIENAMLKMKKQPKLECNASFHQ